MKDTLILTDSNSGILQQEGRDQGIYVIPMPFTVNGEEYLEEISMSQEQFFDALQNDADVKTSQPSEFYLEDLWTTLLKDYKDIIYIPMSGGLSATCANAKTYAGKFDGRVHVVDNKRISISQKLSVLEANAMVKKGMPVREILDYLDKTKSKASIYLTVSVLKYLKKGGRLSPAAAAIGDMLKIKPILYTRGDSFEKFAMTVSMGQARKKMLKQLRAELEGEFAEEYKQGKMVFSIAHTAIPDEAARTKAEIEREFPDMKVLFVDNLSLSVACHTGPGALGIGLMYNGQDIKEAEY